MRTRSRLIVALLTAGLALPAVAATTTASSTAATAAPTSRLGAIADLTSSADGTTALTGHLGAVDPQTGALAGATTDFDVVVETAGGQRRGPVGPYTTAPDGAFDITLPHELTRDLPAGTHAVRAVDVTAVEGETVTLAALEVSEAAGVRLRNSFVSATGWVKPGDSYPFRTFVDNTTDTAVTGAEVTITPPPSSVFTAVETLNGSGEATIRGNGTIVWTIGELAAATEAGPTTATLVVEATAATLEQDPEVVWKDLSNTATLRFDGASQEVSSTTHGPKVIPPTGGYETARYGDKPFPMVLAEYTDRSHQDGNEGAELDAIVNDPTVEGSTFNLYQEMSYGQLFPQGSVPSADIATADWDYEPGFDFTTPDATGTCRGATLASAPDTLGSPLSPERIVDGWYQLPGNTEYYGGDYPAFTLGVAGSIDSACGQIGKGVFDAAQISDPEIDFNDFDSDRDGVVDFFMLVFVGCGGNGGSQLSVATCPYPDAPYDNIWPHSSSLEMQYRDAETGLRGYVSDDQLTSLTGVPQCWTDEHHVVFDDCAADGGTGLDALPAHVRVGPYNVNPETVFESASVISHEYGHHLGLPDFYNSSGAYDAYGTFQLMASDYSQHMTVFAKQDLGWVVPQTLEPGESRTVEDWAEIKTDTGEITWRTPEGTTYTLSAGNDDQNIHNGESYAAKLPSRQLIDPAKVAEQASSEHVFYSGRGNDFGCNPTGGHNLDVWLPELAEVEPGTPVTLRFKSSWDIEWDWDYGFVLTSTDGQSYSSVPSEMGYTTENSYNPNQQSCFTELDNGLTGQSGAYEQGEPFVTSARNPAANDYSAGSPFLTDAYDISALAGEKNAVVRFSYFTDAAFDRPGWFIDDLEVVVGDEVVYASDLEQGDEHGRLFPGGCGSDGINTAAFCTDGWTKVSAEAGSPADHAYYLELRDRALFDFEGHNQSDRGVPTWEPGLFIEYTDESHGYGNNGVPIPPAQHYLDSQPGVGDDCPATVAAPCNDASFTDADGDGSFSDAADDPWVDNFEDPSHPSGAWTFDYGCLGVEVESMTGEETIRFEPDLAADVRLTAGDGCVPLTYFDAAAANTAPVAQAQARPPKARVGQTVTLDGSRSSDDLTPADELGYVWDLGDGSTIEGQTVQTSYAEPGRYEVVLTVTDEHGDEASDRIEVTVAGDSETPEGSAAAAGPLPTTGGGAVAMALALLGAGLGAQRLRRRG